MKHQSIRLVSVGLLVCIFALLFLVTPLGHHLLHQDSCKPSHICIVVKFAWGESLIGDCQIEYGCTSKSVVGVIPLKVFVVTPLTYILPPSCGPPSA